MEIDIHIHSRYSDGDSTIEKIIEQAKKVGLNGIAITDHDTVEGGRYASRYDSEDFTVIPGVEISALEGHILCLGTVDIPEKYLGKKYTPEKYPSSEIIEYIHDLEGIAIAAHPYDKFRDAFGDLIFDLDFDAIEILNGHTLYSTKNPVKVAKKLKLPMVGGSDAHSLGEVGNVHILVGNNPLESIKKGKVEIVASPKLKILKDFFTSGIVRSYFKLQKK